MILRLFLKRVKTMRKTLNSYVVVFLLLSFSAIASVAQISYTSNNLGSGRWQYSYEVVNLALSTPIYEFTIWFDYGLYQNLEITTLDPSASNWGEMTWEPELGLGNGGYDARALSLGISPGETASGFSVRFDWLGTGTPGPQQYEILNPQDFSVIDWGVTIPEPDVRL